MKKLVRILLLLLLTISLGLVAEAEPQRFKEPMKVMLQAYSDGDVATLHRRFSSRLAASLPVDALKETLTKIKAYYGPATGVSFVAMEREAAVYRLGCKRRPLELKLEVDKNGQILAFNLAAAKRIAVYPEVKRNLTKVGLPFKETWYVIWGGDTAEQNYHHGAKFMQYAFDFFQIGPDGRSYRGDGKKNEDYYAFGKDILAPCDGVVTDVVDGVRDNIPGDMNNFYPSGNTVMIKTPHNEFFFFGHFKQNSIPVKAGDKVQRGQVIGQCGNSGSSPEPHLHFHLQNTDDTANATGGKCFFDKVVLVKAEKVEEIKSSYSPVRGDQVKEASAP